MYLGGSLYTSEKTFPSMWEPLYLSDIYVGEGTLTRVKTFTPEWKVCILVEAFTRK